MSFSEICQSIVRGFKNLFGMSSSTAEPVSHEAVFQNEFSISQGRKSVRYPSSPASVTLRKDLTSNSSGYAFEDIYNPLNPFAWANPASPYFRTGYVYDPADHPNGIQYPTFITGAVLDTASNTTTQQDTPTVAPGGVNTPDIAASSFGSYDTPTPGTDSTTTSTVDPTPSGGGWGETYSTPTPAAASESSVVAPEPSSAPSYSAPEPSSSSYSSSSDSGSSYSSPSSYSSSDSGSSSYSSDSGSSSSSSSSDSSGGW